MSYHEESPYLGHASRLADVIAAIQVMGVYRFYKLDFGGWSDRISGSSADAEHWKSVFTEHPEFFRLDSAREKASLVWRRQHPKRYNVDTQQTITREAYEGLSESEKNRVSRTPLTSAEISTLIQTATNLHARALEAKKETRWWASGVFGVIGVLLGALLKN